MLMGQQMDGEPDGSCRTGFSVVSAQVVSSLNSENQLFALASVTLSRVQRLFCARMGVRSMLH